MNFSDKSHTDIIHHILFVDLYPRYGYNVLVKEKLMIHNHDHAVHANRDKTVINLKKAQSHLILIQKMLDDNTYCVDIMQQNLAVIGLLKSAHQMLMEDHLHACFDNAMNSDDDQRKAEMTKEILTVTKLVNR